MVTNHLQTKMDPAVDRRYKMNGNIRGKNGRLDIKEMRKRNIHVPDCSSALLLVPYEKGTDVNDQQT